jgi:hypothetical protein
MTEPGNIATRASAARFVRCHCDAVEAIGNANGIGDFPHGYFSKEGETDEDNFLKEPFGNISLLGTGRRAWAAAFVRLIADNFRHKARPAMTD